MVRCGIIFCGGCNPTIDRKKLAHCVENTLTEWRFLYLNPDDLFDTDILLVINGCHVGCIRPVDSKIPVLLIRGPEFNHRQKSEKELCSLICAELQRLVKEKQYGEVEKDYRKKLKTPEQAVNVIKSGDRVVLAHACGEPQALVRALVHRASELEGVEIVHMVARGKAEYCKPEMTKHFRHNSLFVGASTREAVHQGRADYTPCFFSEIPRLFREGYLPVDVALIQVSPPDKHGFVSVGISVDYTKAAAECAKTVIAQVNPRMPRTYGDSFLHISQIDIVVEHEEPLIELPRPKIGDVERRIGEFVAELIDDGATLQLGIGAIPDAVLSFLKDKKDLGIHTEMFSDGVVELYEAGVITNRAKSINKGKMVATFLMGTSRLYEFVDNNPAVSMHPVDYTNDPCIIGEHEKMVSINSALQVDLLGQVCADTLGLRQFSGVGGQVDFVRGSSRSKNGKSIIAMPSTAAEGTVSRIVSFLDQGAAETTSRNDVHYVVTEYSIAELRGKTVRQRAEALIVIAHPDFRKELWTFLKIMFNKNKKEV